MIKRKFGRGSAARTDDAAARIAKSAAMKWRII
jgi:hypothetical protein